METFWKQKGLTYRDVGISCREEEEERREQKGL
jgi:hypothetical protein